MSNPQENEPYGSADDLPSVLEMRELLRGAKALTRVFARKHRTQFLQVEAQLNALTKLVDDFYALLGPRHWIFPGSLSTEALTSVVELPVDDAERALIDLYKDPETLHFSIMRLHHFPQLQARHLLIERAREDYEAGRYYSTVLVLLAVMDGFVNDVDNSHRGLHTRSDDEMHAWDSAVGHHQGLAAAHRTFTKSFSKTSDAEVFELYRNGIVHGVLLNFDNDVVATKAWNRLFAVADWATARENEAKPVEPEPTLGEVLTRVRENQRDRAVLDVWQPKLIRTDDSGFVDDEMHQLADAYLSAWKRKNYGEMANAVSSLTGADSHGQTAGEVRDGCSLSELSGFKIEAIDYVAAAAVEIDVEVVLNGGAELARMRWIREDEDGDAALPGQDGTWKLINWYPIGMTSRRSQHDKDDDGAS